jgi:hypothetical protein
MPSFHPFHATPNLFELERNIIRTQRDYIRVRGCSVQEVIDEDVSSYFLKFGGNFSTAVKFSTFVTRPFAST